MATIDFSDGTGTYTGTSGDDTFVTTTVAIHNPALPYGHIIGGGGFDTIDVRAVSLTSLGLGQDADGNFIPILTVGNQSLTLQSIEEIEFGDDDNNIDLSSGLSGIIVTAGGGNDYVDVETSATVYAGTGNDTIRVSGTFGGATPIAATIDGGAGTDTLQLNIAFTVDLAAGTATSGTAHYALNAIENVQASTNGYTSSLYGDANANVLSVSSVGDDGSVGVVMDGRGGNDVITGSAGNDNLQGGTGKDVIDGGAGDDVMDGGDGTDTVSYGSASAGVTVSLLLQGQAQNTVGAGMDTLTGFESLSGSTHDDTLTGDDGANVISGDAGSDMIDGGKGADTIGGGAGDDVLHGGDGNDILDGGAGLDRQYGEAGDDTFVVDSASDIVAGEVYDGGDGNDAIHLNFNGASDLSGVSLTGIEELDQDHHDFYTRITVGQLTGLTRISGTIMLADGGTVSMSGKTIDVGVFTLSNAATVFDLTGVTHAQTITVNGGAGNDTLTGSADGDVFNGGNGNDILSGGSGNDTLTGGDDDDQMDGGAGRDKLYGGNGDDTLFINSASDIMAGEIYDGESGVDSLYLNYDADSDLSGVTLAGIEKLYQTHSDVDTRITLGQLASVGRITGGSFTLVDGGSVSLSGKTADVDVFNLSDTSTTFDLTGATVNDTITVNAGAGSDVLTGSAKGDILNGGGGDDHLNGMAGDDVLNAGAGNDVIDGGTGADTMTGGAGADVYYVDNVGDKVIESRSADGTDTVISTVTYSLSGQYLELLVLRGTANINATGNSEVNELDGNSGNNVLNGLGGGDTMQGGLGDDTYVVDNGKDVVIEAANEGTDTVQSSIGYTLTANVENLLITGTGNVSGTGNDLVNRIDGNQANNVIDGKAGADIMAGHGGDDTYYVDNAADQVIETLSGGNDKVFASTSWTMGAYVEALTLSGTADIDATGNAQADRIDGNNGANIIDGKAGADIMAGHGGNDTYYVDNAGDQVIETSSGGNDKVFSSVSYTLSDYVEALQLTGTAAINATGSAQVNTITGNTGANILDGGKGSDTLTGGAGNDIFLFDTTLGTSNIDTITDFTVGEDRIRLDKAIFAALGADGTLAAGAFGVGTAATTADQRIIYNSSTGDLYYDKDGNGSAAATKFANVGAGLSLTNNSFSIQG